MDAYFLEKNKNLIQIYINFNNFIDNQIYKD